MNLVIEPRTGLRGDVSVPGDKSISHRAVMFSSLARGATTVKGFLRGADCLSTVACMRDLGIRVEDRETEMVIYGQGLYGLQEPADVLQAGNSGTTIRLLLGILAGHGLYAVLTGDDSIRRRPMGRIIQPLTQMGAEIYGRAGNTLAPVVVRGAAALRPVTYHSPVASAQIKSAVLLAGLFLDGETTVIEPSLSRDHSERMLRAFGAKVVSRGVQSTVSGKASLVSPGVIDVPGDISSAAFLLVAGCIVPDSDILVRGVGVNPTRTGIVEALQQMGADLTLENPRDQSGEPVADIRVRSSRLKGITIGGDLLPRLIDEVPVLAVAAATAEGPTVIRDAAELRVKETDRIQTMARELANMGVTVEEKRDGMIIPGGAVFTGGRCDSHGDHRIAMSMAVAGLIARDATTIADAGSIDVSFPDFAALLRRL
ncbi:MAG TPA: 3-phosphoshikimate 1-carboxyvinyltransferase [Negativicutes bacterium]|nr:3-phosphoshikimate 1-carboxyvinyltransferase [Negativicutes bacterium]